MPRIAARQTLQPIRRQKFGKDDKSPNDFQYRRTVRAAPSESQRTGNGAGVMAGDGDGERSTRTEPPPLHNIRSTKLYGR